jgi:hypothetical protein
VGEKLEWEKIGSRDISKEIIETVPSKNHLALDFGISNGKEEEGKLIKKAE